MLIFFEFDKFVLVMDVMNDVFANNLFQASSFSIGYNGESAKKFLTDLLMMRNYMLLTVVYIFYHYFFVPGAVLFDQLSEFVV